MQRVRTTTYAKGRRAEERSRETFGTWMGGFLLVLIAIWAMNALNGDHVSEPDPACEHTGGHPFEC